MPRASRGRSRAARPPVEQAQRDSGDATDVDMATGLVVAAQGCTAEQAEGLLRRAADDEEQTVLQIASRIIEQHTSSR
jgi:AmiR/NasT family two-component response regulator